MKQNTNHIETIEEKIAFLECLKEVINSTQGRRDYYCSYDDNSNPIPPTSSATDYERTHYNAYNKILDALYKLAE